MLPPTVSSRSESFPVWRRRQRVPPADLHTEMPIAAGLMRRTRRGDGKRQRESLTYFTEPGGLRAIERGTRMTTTDSPGDTDHELLRRLEQVATTLFGGHFTIMRFGSNWRVGFTTPNDRHDITAMAEGRTFAEAADKALQRIKEAVWADQAKRRADVEESMSPSTRAAPAGSGIHERTTWTL
jgi:hypothetical protein